MLAKQNISVAACTSILKSRIAFYSIRILQHLCQRFDRTQRGFCGGFFVSICSFVVVVWSVLFCFGVVGCLVVLWLCLFVFAYWLNYIFLSSVPSIQENIFHFMKLTLDCEMSYFIKWSASYFSPVLLLGHNGSF